MAIIDVIKYEGRNNVLVWKHPREDFNTSAELIVHESQEAILFRDGEASLPFNKGKHTIETENIPGIRGVVELVTGGISPNHYEVFFVNLANVMEVYWGTNSPWLIQDPNLQMPFEIRARGQATVRVIDSRQFVLRLIGTTTGFTVFRLQQYFGSILIQYVKEQISKVFMTKNIGFMAINSKLRMIADSIKEGLVDVYAKYGLEVDDFVVEAIDPIENEYLGKVLDALATRTGNTLTGVSELDKMAYGVAMAQAQSTGAGGQMAQMMTGIAAGAAAAPAIGGIMRNVMSNTNSNPSNVVHPDPFSMGTIGDDTIPKATPPHLVCCKCGRELDENAVFCSFCGTEQKGKNDREDDTGGTCPICGSMLPKGSVFCMKCGAHV